MGGNRINNLYYIYLFNIVVYLYMLIDGYSFFIILASGLISAGFLALIIKSLYSKSIIIRQRSPVKYEKEPIVFIFYIIIFAFFYIVPTIILFFPGLLE